MSTPEPSRLAVFISYLQSPDQERRIRELVERLRVDGIECRTARSDEAPPAEWPQRTAEYVAQADVVLVVCTETYAERFQGGSSAKDESAAGWQGAILTQALYEAETDKRKFIPVLWSSQDWRHIPQSLRKITRYTLDSPDGYDALARRLDRHPSPRESGAPAEPATRSDPVVMVTQIPWAVPHGRNPFFTGRRDILDQLRMELTSNGVAGLTQPHAFAQFGGTGKTHTAVEYAHRYRDQYRTVLWADAQSLGSFIADLVAIEAQLELLGSSRDDHRAAMTAVSGWLHDHSDWLLILDDVEDPELIESWLPRPLRGQMLLILREQGADRLGIAQTIEVGGLLPAEAEQLLLSRSGPRDSNPGEAQALSQLAGELAGVPLALELAGAYMAAASCGFQDYLFLYRRYGVDLLDRPRAGVSMSSQPAGIAGLLNLEQVEQQSVPAAELLRASALLAPAPIPIDLIVRGGDELGPEIAAARDATDGGRPSMEALLGTLQRYSLVHRTLEGDRYEVHRFIQALVKEQMDDPSRQRRAECVVRAVSQAVRGEGTLGSPPPAPYLAHLHAASELIGTGGFTFPEAEHLRELDRLLLSSRADLDRAARSAETASGSFRMAPSPGECGVPETSGVHPSKEPAIEEAGLLLGEAPCFEDLSWAPSSPALEASSPVLERSPSEEPVSEGRAEPLPAGDSCDKREIPMSTTNEAMADQAPSAGVAGREEEQELQLIPRHGEAVEGLRLASPDAGEAELGLDRSEAGEVADTQDRPTEQPSSSSDESLPTALPLPITLASLETTEPHDPLLSVVPPDSQAGEGIVTEQAYRDDPTPSESEPWLSVESTQTGETAQVASSEEESASLASPEAPSVLEPVQPASPTLAGPDVGTEPDSPLMTEGPVEPLPAGETHRFEAGEPELPGPSRDRDLPRPVSEMDGVLSVEDRLAPVVEETLLVVPESVERPPCQTPDEMPDRHASREDEIVLRHVVQMIGETGASDVPLASTETMADLNAEPPQPPALVQPADVPVTATVPEAQEESDAVEAAARLDQQAAALIHRNRPLEAIRLYKQSLAVRERAFGSHDLHIAPILDKLAEIFDAEGRTTEAKQCYKRALAIREQALGLEHADVATTLDRLAGLYFSAGRSTEARQFYARSLAIREQILGGEHQDVATSLDHLAALYCALGRYAKAESLCKRSLAIKEKTLGANHPQMAVTLTHYAAILRKWHREAEAEKIERRLRTLTTAASKEASASQN